MKSSTISSKGQVTVPIEVRVRLGLREGDRVEFLTEGGVAILRPARNIENPFEAYAGKLGTFPGGKEEIGNWISEMRDEDPN